MINYHECICNIIRNLLKPVMMGAKRNKFPLVPHCFALVSSSCHRPGLRSIQTGGRRGAWLFHPGGRGQENSHHLQKMGCLHLSSIDVYSLGNREIDFDSTV